MRSNKRQQQPPPQFPEVQGERLALVSLGPDAIDALLTRGPSARHELDFALPPLWPDEADQRLLQLRLDQMRLDPSSQPWLLRAMVLRNGTRPMIGHIGFHGPPIEGAAEIGYTVFPEHRRRGYAREAVLTLMHWSREAHGVQRFIVSISPDNAPSLALASAMGFVRTGEQMDEVDGLEYVFELRP